MFIYNQSGTSASHRQYMRYSNPSFSNQLADREISPVTDFPHLDSVLLSYSHCLDIAGGALHLWTRVHYKYASITITYTNPIENWTNQPTVVCGGPCYGTLEIVGLLLLLSFF